MKQMDLNLSIAKILRSLLFLIILKNKLLEETKTDNNHYESKSSHKIINDYLFETDQDIVPVFINVDDN